MNTTKHAVTIADLIEAAHMTNEEWDKSEFNDAKPKPISEAYSIKNVDIRNLLTVAVGTLSNQTGESFDSALSRGTCADEILRRFNETKSQLDAYSIGKRKNQTEFLLGALQRIETAAREALKGAQK